jgi:iron complex transport system substrate-binding protein
MIRRLLLLCSCLVALTPFTLAAVTLLDDAGSEIELKREASRIITLAPHIVEQLFAIGAGQQVVGTVSYSDYPAAAKNIPLIGGYDHFDMEAIVALKPDLVIGWLSGNSVAQIEQIRRLGIPLFLDEPRRVDDIAKNIERLGLITGRQQQGAVVAQNFRAELQRLRKRYHSKTPVTIFYQLWPQPLMTINGEQIINDIFNYCGGENIFRELSALTPVVSREAVIAADPEVIIIAGNSAAQSLPELEWLAWRSMRAVEAGHLYVIDPDIIHRASPRMLQGAMQICGFIDAAR